MIYQGFLARSPEGRTRVFLLDDRDRSYVDVDEHHVREARLVDDREASLAVWAVDVDDGAPVAQGRLDADEFDALFSWASEAGPVHPATFPSRPGTTCGVHDTSTRMGICVD